MASKNNIDTNAFIEAYRREACLWNVFDEEYKNRVTKRDAQKRYFFLLNCQVTLILRYIH